VRRTIEGAENWEPDDLARFCATVQKEAGDDIELHVFPAAQARTVELASFAAYIIAHGIPLALEESAV
jgi:hypothetical protein